MFNLLRFVFVALMKKSRESNSEQIGHVKLYMFGVAMSTIYQFKNDPSGADLEIVHNIISPDTWLDKAQSDKLVVPSGFVDSSGQDRLVCQTGPPENNAVVTLLGASWSTEVKSTGQAVCNLCNNTPDNQTWILAAKN